MFLVEMQDAHLGNDVMRFSMNAAISSLIRLIIYKQMKESNPGKLLLSSVGIKTLHSGENNLQNCGNTKYVKMYLSNVGSENTRWYNDVSATRLQENHNKCVFC